MNTQETQTPQEPRRPTLTRREALALAAGGAGALLIADLSAFAADLPEVLDFGTAGNAFALTTRTPEGIVVRAIAEPQWLAFAISGPIAPKHPIPLVTLPMEGEDLNENQKEAEQAALALLAASGSFVAPRSIELDPKKKLHDKVRVRFMFLGPEGPERSVRLQALLQDGAGRTLQDLSRVCADPRPSARIASKRLSRLEQKVSLANVERFEIPKGILEEVARVEVIFEEL